MPFNTALELVPFFIWTVFFHPFQLNFCYIYKTSFRPLWIRTMIQAMLINDNFPIWFLTSWQYSCQPVRSHVRKSFLNSIDFNIHFLSNTGTTVYPKKYAHGFCFAVLCCGYTLTDFPISIRLTSLALWQSNDCPSASKATLMNMDKYFMWIHYERLHNHNKAKHNKTMCIFLGIYCSYTKTVAGWPVHHPPVDVYSTKLAIGRNWLF